MVIDRSRRWWGVLLGMLLVACTVAPGRAPSVTPSERPDWHEATPESAGFDPAMLASVLQSVRERGAGLHEVVVVRDNALILDAVADPYDGATPHQVGEITETIVTTLLGIAIDRGVLGLDDPVLPILAAGTVPPDAVATWERVTVRDLAAMTSGIGCRTSDDRSMLAAMMASPDWVAFASGLPLVSEPGTTFRTCRPAAHLLTAVLQAATGVPALEFARQFLFDPLGISHVRWMTDPQGIQRGWADLYLRPVDLARIGVMWLNGGTWNDRRIVSEAWLRATTSERVVTGALEDYGLGWWLSPSGAAHTVEAHGSGGQLLHLRPALGLVVVTVGSGLNPSDLVAPIVASLASPDGRLLTDAQGGAALAIAGTRLRDGPASTGGTTSTAAVRAIAGIEWSIDDNPIGLARLRLDLKQHRAEGSVALGFGGPSWELVGPIGLDGRYRLGLDPYRRPVAVRGSWASKRTFVLDVDEVTAGRAYTLRLTVGSGTSTVTVEGDERGARDGFVVEGRAAPLTD